MNQSTTILFVPGAWHTNLTAMIPLCNASKQSATRPTRSIYPPVDPPTHYLDFSADVSRIRAQSSTPSMKGGMWSWLRTLTAACPRMRAIKGLDINTRQKVGLTGGVTHLFFCCSFVIAEGQSLISAFGGNDLPWFRVSDDKV
ncbi:alpha/beta-hydrolase [Penicillium cinerascens]|uniref:Alpha/beta-hydrolase n=1 Tax=Penicillium cinerascens TaxID=70096 RepID=A0A9W9J5C3_9EURO|nr:alpha/beta-hydrolase [Penicillium cinerascens]KAJ5190112.1 alpha/beta-hydrolase [Penicillium cinerascens]